MADHFHPHTTQVARKDHRCMGCYDRIPAGRKYASQSGFFEGRAFRNKFHLECWEELSDEHFHRGEREFTPGECDPPRGYGNKVDSEPVR